MRILFLNPNWNQLPARAFPGCKRPHHPLELLYPATALSGKHQVLVIDAFLERLNDADLQQRISSFNPEAVVLTTAPGYLFWRCCPLDISLPKRTSNLVRSSCKAALILIGPHPTVSPSWVLDECHADYLVRGEAELSIAEFINSGLNNMEVKGLFGKDLDNGIAVVDDLGLLPEIDFGLLPFGPYHSHSPKYERGASIEFSRGCTFQCSFCFKQFFRNKYRMRSVDKVLEEVKGAKKLGYRYIYFIDELFNRDSEQMRELLKGLKEIEIAWGCQCRPDIMTQNLLQAMKESGCENIEYGLETLSQESSKAMKKQMNLDRSMAGINLSAELGITTTIFFVYGVPGETKDSIKDAFHFLDKLDRRVGFSSALLIPFPTTPVYESLVGTREHAEENDWKNCADLVGKTCNISHEDMEKIIIISHLGNHLRNSQLPEMLIRNLVNLLDRFPAKLYSSLFGLLLSIRKERDIQ